MKKVLFINSNKVWGGGEKWHYNMALALRANGHQISMICAPNSELSLAAKKQDIQVYEVDIKNFSFLNPFKLMQAKKVVKSFSPDCIFLNLPSDVKFSAFLSYLISMPKIIYRRGMPHPLRNSLLNRFTFSRVSLFIANSKEIEKSIIKNIPELKSKVKVIYNGVIPREFSSNTIKKTLILGNLGRLVHQKGQRHLIEVAKILKANNIDFKLLIGGKGPDKESLQTLIDENNLSKDIILEGHVDSEIFLKKIDIFLFTSYFEGSANALIEALQYHKPAIAFDVSSNPEVVTDDLNGYLVPFKDEVAMAEKTILLSQSPEIYDKLQVNTQKVVLEKFNYTDKIKEVESLLYE